MSTQPDAGQPDDLLTVADLSEGDLLARVVPLLPRGPRTLVPNGDDAAVVAAPDGRFVVSTDVLVEHHHFRRDWGTARDVGARAAAQNLADIAAMGAVPTSMVLALAMPPATPVTWVLDLARGLADVCGPAGVGVDGGDLSAAEQIVVAVTVHGDLEGRIPVLRSGARPGDMLAHAGSLGRAAAGYEVLASGRYRGAPDAVEDPAPTADPGPGSTGHLTGALAEVASAVVGSFLRPTPPLAAGPAAADAGATAMMDVSDGLLRDAGRLAQASGVVVELDPLAISVPEDLAALEPLARDLGGDAVAWLLTGGEDHGILATFPAGTTLPPGFRRLGVVTTADDGGPRVTTSEQRAGSALDDTGWDHFRRR